MGVNVRATTSFINIHRGFLEELHSASIKSVRGTVNTQELEPENLIHWYNGALASYYLED